jgi:hypothetical protein
MRSSWRNRSNAHERPHGIRAPAPASAVQSAKDFRHVRAGRHAG